HMERGLTMLKTRRSKMQKIIAQAKDFVRDENGITALEYGLLAGLITVLLIASMKIIGTGLQTVFQDIASAV
ncbi:Flp family type IVb pilin, partial [Paraburkholderia sp. EG285A]|uniref:Flp family type IVb pilin n=1 Tax=Paraburkholderia sp. EG285A TaxID=3237009 RepID=UPI0034D215E8